MQPETQPNHLSWTITRDPSLVEDVEFRRVSGKKVQHEEPLHGKLTAKIAHHFDGQKQRELIQSRKVHKPEWFQKAESDARTFMASLGFQALSNIYLLEGELERERELAYEKEVYLMAFNDSITRNILASEVMMTRSLHTKGMIATTSILVHELAHNTAPKPERIVMQQHADNTSHYVSRHGWTAWTGDHERGRLLEEGFCEYIASLYRRDHTDTRDTAALPTIELPPYMQTNSHCEELAAYTIELMAWGVEQHGIMPADTFISHWFDARKEETFTSATREIIQAIESLAPDLYPYLRDLEYSKDNWTAARDAVYKIVTQK